MNIDSGFIAHLYLFTVMHGKSVEIERYQFLPTERECIALIESEPVTGSSSCIPMRESHNDSEELVGVKKMLREYQETKRNRTPAI